MSSMKLTPFFSDEEVEEVMRRIRTHVVCEEQFMHREHLAMAAWISLTNKDDPLTEIRDTILAINKANDIVQTETRGYHETLTVAWYRLVAAHISELAGDLPKFEKVNSVLKKFTNKRVILMYYTKEHVMNWTARKEWVEPDRRSLPEIK